MVMRLRCPLQQQRGGANMDPQLGERLPPIGQQGGQALGRRWMRGAGASGLSTLTKAPAKREERQLVVPGPEQQAKAERLMKGYSSRGRSLSASAAPGDRGSQLPNSIENGIIHAREWRKRLQESNARRPPQVVPVKVHTFDFGAFPGEEGV
ncbi:unnamed protein product [Discosporangium mesarthrocarpum]